MAKREEIAIKKAFCIGKKINQEQIFWTIGILSVIAMLVSVIREEVIL